MKKYTFWFISDTHNHHRELYVPDVDIVIFCGDESTEYRLGQNYKEAKDFFDWYSGLDIEHKIYIPGNHSRAVEVGLILQKDYPNICFLIHEMVIVNDISIFGSPYTPTWGKCQSYMINRDAIAGKWESLYKTDILVTHGPPMGVLDITRDRATKELMQVGCKYLYEKVKEISPKIHAFGHIHEEGTCKNYGTLKLDDHTQFINCACSHRGGRIYNGVIKTYYQFKSQDSQDSFFV